MYKENEKQCWLEFFRFNFFFFFVPVMNFIICFPSFEEKLAYWNHVLFTFKFSGNVTFCMKKKKGRKISKISLHYRPEKKTKNRDKISFIVWWQKFDHLHNSKKNSNLTKKWSMSQFWKWICKKRLENLKILFIRTTKMIYLKMMGTAIHPLQTK